MPMKTMLVIRLASADWQDLVEAEDLLDDLPGGRFPLTPFMPLAQNLQPTGSRPVS